MKWLIIYLKIKKKVFLKMSRTEYPITISRKILEELINVKVFEAETALRQTLLELVKPCDRKALAA